MLESQAIQLLTEDPRVWEGLGLAPGDDKLLLAAFARGDRAAFERIVALYEPRVRRLAWRLLGWAAHDAEDVTQDVFLAALEQSHKFRGDSSLWPWLTAITMNKCRSRQRRSFLRVRWLRQRRDDEVITEPAEHASVREETSEKVRRAIRALPPRDREVIVLYYLEDRTVAQISAMLRLSENATDVRLHRARKRLKELLGDLSP